MPRKPMNADVIAIMRSYDPRDYLDGDDLREWDILAELMDGITVHVSTGETAADITDDDYDRAARYLNLPLMSEQPPETADIDDPRGQLRGKIGFELYKRTIPLKNAAKKAFAVRYMQYPHEAMHVLAEIETDIIITLRESVKNLVDSVEELERAQIDAMRNGINLDNALIRSLGDEPSADVLKQTALLSETMHRVTECVDRMFGDEMLQAEIVGATAHLIHLLGHAGWKYLQRATDNRYDRIARKWTIKPRRKSRSHSTAKRDALSVQSTAQPTDYVFGRSKNNDLLTSTGQASYKAKFNDAIIPCRVLLKTDSFDDMYDPQIDCIQPQHRPVYRAIETICARHAAEGRPLNEIVIPFGTLLREMEISTKRRIDDEMKRQIRTALECMMRHFVWVDCLDEGQAYGFDGTEFAVWEPIIDGRILMVDTYGQKTLSLVLDRLPVLLRYALKCSKYITFDERYILGGMERFTLHTMAQRDYIARHIFMGYGMRTSRQKGTCRIPMRLETMANALGIDPTSKSSMKYLRLNTKSFLDAWAQTDATDGSRFQLIAGYDLQKTGNAITGYDIELLPRDIASFQLPPQTCQMLSTP